MLNEIRGNKTQLRSVQLTTGSKASTSLKTLI